MHEMPRRLGLIAATVLTVGLAAFPAYTGADGGGNGNGHSHGNGGGNGNGPEDNGNGGGGVDQVVICHVPPGNPDNAHTIEVGEPAVDAHLNHGDSVGPCDATTTTSTSTTTTQPSVAPVANDDDTTAIAGLPFSFNVLDNDVLGSPPATITQVIPFGDAACAVLSFDQETGVISGTPPFGICNFFYMLSNSAGQSDAFVTITFNLA